MTVVRSQSVRQAHNLHIELEPYNNSSITIVSADESPSSSSGRPTGSSSSHETSSARNSRIVQFSVLCLHDYDSTEESGLSFHKNEILQILEQEPTGWWAARRKGTREIGWIPKAFVAPLTPELADRYEKMREEIRSYEHDAEQLYAEAPISKLNLIDSDDSPTPSVVSRNNSIEGSRSSLSRTMVRTKSRDVLGRSPQKMEVVKHPPQPEPNHSHTLPQPPPSPSSPMPHPPPLSAPLYNKPFPPLPHEASNIRIRAGSLSSRSLRRRPLLLDDNTALSRLSTLIETKNAREIDKYANPDIVGSMRALSKRNREQARPKDRNLQTPFHILDRPWYLLPGHADELELDKDGHVRSGTLFALVERLTSECAFSNPKNLNDRNSFASAFLMTLRTFTTSDELFDLLLERFSLTRPDNLTDVEVEDWKKRCLYPTQRHVLTVFTLWLEEHRMLEDDPHIAQRLPDFVTRVQVAMPRLSTESQALMHTFERVTFADPTPAPMGLTPRKPRKSKAHKNELSRMDPTHVAEQVTLYEYNRYSKITPRECLAYLHTQTGNSVTNLAAFCRTYDQLAGWVKLSILNNEVIAKRASTIDFWIKVAEKCRQLNNFVSMSAILSALSSTDVTRLLLTWAHVGRKSQLDTLSRHNEPSGGFSAYRTLLAGVDNSASCVPFITMYLSDIVRIRELSNDQPGRVCFIQRQRWFEAISSMLKFQRRPYLINFDESIASFIYTSLQESSTKDDAWFWARSQEVQHAELAHADIRKGLEQAGF